jgi:hypothetical protein
MDAKTLRFAKSHEWAKLDAEFHDIQAVLAAMPRETYHPVTFHFGTETVGDAAIRLKGQSSWVDTVMFDANPKMQLVIAFDQFDPHGRFHGVDKIPSTTPRGALGAHWFDAVFDQVRRQMGGQLDPETLRARGFANLFPVGEGAGSAGGIMSAAIDGARAAQALLRDGL